MMKEYQIIISLITSAISASGVGVFLKLYLTEKITSKVKSQYDKELEHLKSDLLSHQSMINSVINSQQESYKTANSERIESIKTYWKAYMMILNGIKHIADIDSAILIDEVGKEKFMNNEMIINFIKNSPKRTGFEVPEELLVGKSVQPFLSESLWIYLTFLISFTSRIIFIYQTGLKSGKVEHWTKDGILQVMLRGGLDQKEYSHVKSSELGKINAVLAFTETKMINEINHILNGKYSAQYSYDYALGLIEAKKVTNVPIDGF